MSEFIQNSAARLNALNGFARGIITGQNGKMLIDQYQVELNTVTPTETMQVLDQMLMEGFSAETVKTNVGKILNVFYKSLSAYTWEKPSDDHFLTFLMLENREVEKIMSGIKGIVKLLFNTVNPDEQKLFDELRQHLSKLKQYELHYIKKENILFPFIEKVFSQSRCLQIMWSFHDDFRRSIKVLDQILEGNPDKNALNKELGKLFFVVLPIIFREEQIVFPVSYRAIPEKAWQEMLYQSVETGWCYITPPSEKVTEETTTVHLTGKINLGTGYLTPEQITLLFNNLPVDITFVDENDEVIYFSGAKHRIFPRSKAIIGRKVQNCHPPESVHVVNEIVNAFRNGTKDHADFWLQMKGLFIYIRYFAIRDEQGQYKGTIEVSQDVTGIRQLQGQRRLLEWE